jgi:hypothetical protein
MLRAQVILPDIAGQIATAEAPVTSESQWFSAAVQVVFSSCLTMI